MMRKFYLSLGMIICLVFAAHAQRTAVGLKAGINFATIDDKGVDDNEFILGYHVGLMINAPIALGVSLQPEVLFSLKGSGVPSSEDNLSLMYVEIPIMGKVKLGEVLNLQLGPYVGALINSKKGNDNFGDVLKTFDAGVALGLGVALSDRLSLDGRYTYGLTDVYEKNVPFPIIRSPGGNRVLQLSLGYLFGGNR